EYRLLLRHDNEELRLTEMGHQVGLVKEDQYQAYLKKKAAVEAEIKRLRTVRIKPTEEVQAFLATINAAPLKDGVLASDFLKRPEISYSDLM
ncbi:tRNA uridine-5-carboxymethylaminomethyl(34) synthesis enzyme MnmG, partial [Bacillus cereus]|nr:tRNA uridine-5-carboxymethylaminomethyl(34) synthesis enzyme MnmG [Bacillus cereus]